MPIDDMLQEGTDKTLDDRVARPLQEPTVRPSFGSNAWSTFTSAPRSVATGASEMAGSLSDILGAYGKFGAGYGGEADPTMLLDPKAAQQRRVDSAAARAEVEKGNAFSTDMGDSFRSGAKTYMPDPATAGAAENLIFSLGRFMTKAVGYSVVGGPIVGAVMTGVDEGMTEADRLKAQGVDIGARTKVGAVAGVVAGVSVALPMAGKTIAQTAGLVAVGGPGAFIAQQAASKAILQHANYENIGNQYDPNDPVGLTVSTLIPFGFGMYGMRGYRAQPKPATTPVRTLADMGGHERLALKYDDARLDAYTVAAAQREGIPPEALLAIKNVGEKSGPTAVSPRGAKGVMQFMDETWAAYGKGDPRDPAASIDAGARYMKDLIKQYDGDVRAAIAHYNGGGKAGKAVKEGRAAPAAETRKYLDRTDAFIAERSGTEAGRAAASDPEAVAAARVDLVRTTVESWNLKDPTDIAGAQEHLNAVLRASDQLGAGERADVGNTISLDNLSRARLFDDMVGRLETARANHIADAGNIVTEPGALKTMRDQITQLEQSRPAATDEALRTRAKEIQGEQGISYKASLSAAKKDIATRLGDITGQVQRLDRQVDTHRTAAEAQQQVKQLDAHIAQVKFDRAGIDAPTPKPMALAVKQVVIELPKAKPETKPDVTASKTTETASKAPESASNQPQGASNAKAGTNPLAASFEAQTAELARLAPDMMVQLEGMEAPMRLADAMETIKAEAARDVQDAPLLQVAAECFLRNS